MSISPDGRSEITLKLCLLRQVEKKWVEEEQSVDREEVEDKEVEDKEVVASIILLSPSGCVFTSMSRVCNRQG